MVANSAPPAFYSMIDSDPHKIVVIHSFEDDLKNLIRERIREICWGPAVYKKSLLSENYKATMKSLHLRISSKSDTIKIGMIGELITHLFLHGGATEHISVNKFTNLEEASIKKGFDLMLNVAGSDEIKLVEVKSGQQGKLTSVEKLMRLLKQADADMIGKLNNPADNLWRNALNHCESALRGDLRDKIEEIVEKMSNAAYTAPNARDYHVVLSAVSFSNSGLFCDQASYMENFSTQKSWGSYKSVNFFVAQKKTYEAIIDFIAEEAA